MSEATYVTQYSSIPLLIDPVSIAQLWQHLFGPIDTFYEEAEIFEIPAGNAVDRPAGSRTECDSPEWMKLRGLLLPSIRDHLFDRFGVTFPKGDDPIDGCLNLPEGISPSAVRGILRALRGFVINSKVIILHPGSVPVWFVIKMGKDGRISEYRWEDTPDRSEDSLSMGVNSPSGTSSFYAIEAADNYLRAVLGVHPEFDSPALSELAVVTARAARYSQWPLREMWELEGGTSRDMTHSASFLKEFYKAVMKNTSRALELIEPLIEEYRGMDRYFDKLLLSNAPDEDG